MKVTAIKTPLVKVNQDLSKVITDSMKEIPEKSVVAISSKLVSTCEGRFVNKKIGTKQEKFDLVKQEAEYYTDPKLSKYDIMLTVKDNWMFVNAGIDESNADGKYLLWPKDPQTSVNQIWQFLRKHYQLKKVGVVMTDSRSIPLNWGVTGHAIAHCGFQPLKSYIGQKDLFGREMKMEQLNIMQSLAAAAVVEMGEGDEQTPLALIENVKHIQFQDHQPTQEELSELKIALEDDIYAPLLSNVAWQKSE